MKNLFNRIKSNSKIEKVLRTIIIIVAGLYVFSIPTFSGNKLYLVSYGIMVLLIGCVALFYIFYKKITFDRRIMLIFAFVIESLIGTLIYTPHEIRRWVSVVLMSLTLVVFYYSFKCINKPRLLLKIIVAAFGAFALVYMVFYREYIFKPQLAMSLRLGWDFDNVNLIGTYFSIGFMISFYLAILPKKKLEILYSIPTLIFAYLGLFAGSRTFLVTTGVALIVILFFRFKNKKWLFFALLGLLVVVGIVLINLPFMAYYKEQLNRMLAAFGIGNGKVDASVVERVAWLKYGLYLGSKNLLFGYGAEGFANYSAVGTYTHNNYAEVLCDFGIIGLLLFYLPFAYSFGLAVRSKDENSRVVVAIIIFYLVKGFFGVYYYYKDAYFMMALCLYLTNNVTIGKYREKITVKNQEQSLEEIAI